MKLKIKDEYKEWSIAASRQRVIKLTNLDPSLYEFYYKNGYSEFFEEVVIKKDIKEVKTQNNKDIENDTNK